MGLSKMTSNTENSPIRNSSDACTAIPNAPARFSANLARRRDRRVISLGLSAQSSPTTAVVIHFLSSFCPSMAAAWRMEVISELIAMRFTILSRDMVSAVSLPMMSAALVSSKLSLFTMFSNSM